MKISPSAGRRSAARITAAVLSVLGLWVMWRGRNERVSGSDTENITWGANDPTWSPDGRRLAFSLFGSIWTAPATGGQAIQLTTSQGYHAHPSWSPAGNEIAFVRGQTPAGFVTNISGALMVVNVADGREREISISGVAGTVSWSADGSRLVAAVRAPGGGNLLHEVNPADGTMRPLQPMPASAPSSNWTDTAWNPKRGEIFFATTRGRAPQVWSIDAAGPPITIQMPLTRYKAEDIVWLNRISALPDGSGVIYSADVVNGRGNFELYRIPRQGGAPVAITNTDRDELAPAVSPDGTQIAHVSNHLGNIDVFTMPVAGGTKTHVRLESLQFRTPGGQLRLRVSDESGNPAPARVYVEASDGKSYCPAGVPIFYYNLDPGKGREGFFVGSGDDTFPVPGGKVRLVVLKGVEYEIVERSIHADAGQVTDVNIQLSRWTDWSKRGWYTGENHFHANYNGSYYQRPKQSLGWLEAEDLNTANMVVANAAGAFIHDKEFFRGAVDPISKPRFVLYWGQEYRNSSPLGHMAFLNITKQVPPSFTSVPGSNSPYDFPLNTAAALEARKQGGLVSYVHPIGAVRDVFDSNLSAREMPVTAALGAVDSIDVLPYGESAYELWYRFLNSGFKITPGAGTDVFTNWRGINQIPGGARTYVEIGSTMSWDRWIERYREGRNFVTNGPLLNFQINGEPMGKEIKIPGGQPYPARLTVTVESRSPLERVEFIQNGIVIASEDAGGARSHRMQKEVSVTASSWFAARATGKPARATAAQGSIPRAHSGAIYITAGGVPTLIKDDVQLMLRWIDRLWALLEERDNLGPGKNREMAHQMVLQARRHYEAKLPQAR